MHRLFSGSRTRPVTRASSREDLIEHFVTVLTREQEHRAARSDVVDGQVAWIGAERAAMVAAVAALRPDLPVETVQSEVLAVEESARGHSDYTVKYALRCAFIVEAGQYLPRPVAH